MLVHLKRAYCKSVKDIQTCLYFQKKTPPKRIKNNTISHSGFCRCILCRGGWMNLALAENADIGLYSCSSLCERNIFDIPHRLEIWHIWQISGFEKESFYRWLRFGVCVKISSHTAHNNTIKHNSATKQNNKDSQSFFPLQDVSQLEILPPLSLSPFSPWILQVSIDFRVSKLG